MAFLVVSVCLTSFTVLKTPLKVKTPLKAGKNYSVLIYVNSTIRSAINDSLMQWKADLEATGRTITIINYTASFPTRHDEAVNLKTNILTHSNIDGVIFVGKMPYVLYNVSTPSIDIFPCDLYFMDLDGQWTDADGNLIFESHTAGTGDRDPEIWVGRIDASTMIGGMNETDAISAYLSKVHQYREGTLRAPHSSLLYIDDDWDDWASEWANSSVYAYTNQTIIASENITTANHYETTLTHTYELVHLFVHSYYNEHVFYVPPGYTEAGRTNGSEILNLNPQAFFYVLFACSAADYSQTNNIATYYLFAGNTLAVLGSTKTGGLYEPEWFYRPLGNDDTWGNALKRWFSDCTLASAGLNNPYNSYGMTIFGDPTLQVLLGDPRPGGTTPIPGFTIPMLFLTIFAFGLAFRLFNYWKPKMREESSLNWSI
ncbi:MAG: C25 family cysteine peptidase [Candidatus Helarchaeota archaeon]